VSSRFNKRERSERLNGPVEHAKKLHDTLFSSCVTTSRDLDRELMNTSVGAEEGQSSEEGTVGVNDLVFVVDVTDSNEIVVVVLVLEGV